MTYMYHVASEQRWDSIAEHGLRPEILSPKLAEIVGFERGLYLWDNLPRAREYAYGEAESLFDLNEAEWPIYMVLIRAKLPEDATLVEDPNLEGLGSFITNVSIPPEDVAKIETFKFTI